MIIFILAYQINMVMHDDNQQEINHQIINQG